jgi:hypothetical protein
MMVDFGETRFLVREVREPLHGVFGAQFSIAHALQ